MQDKMKKQKIIIFTILILAITLNAKADYKVAYNEYKSCILKYDDCIADFLDTFVNMGGDSVQDCKIERKECEEVVEKLIKEKR